MLATLVKRTMLALACVTALLVYVAGARAQTPVLRAHVTVDGPLVTLGDLFENAGKLAETPVFRAPDPGHSGTVQAVRVDEVARAHGLAWRDEGLLPAITVARSSQRIGIEEIAAMLEQALRTRLDILPPGRLAVTLSDQARALHLPIDASTELAVERLELRGGGTFKAEIVARRNGVAAQRATYHGQAVETVAVPVLTRPIARGETIRAADVALAEVPRARLARDAVGEDYLVIGQAARRNLAAGSPLRTGDLEQPKLVRRGDLVTIRFDRPGLVLSVRGRALGDGAHGDSVSVVNGRSNRVIDATVTAAGTVSVNAEVTGSIDTSRLAAR